MRSLDTISQRKEKCGIDKWFNQLAIVKISTLNTPVKTNFCRRRKNAFFSGRHMAFYKCMLLCV